METEKDETFVSFAPGSAPSSEESLAEDREIGRIFEKKVLRKIDFWLVGFYSLVYIFRVIDSSNYSNAAIINLEAGTNIKTQLHLDPAQWAWTLSIFSYSYLIFEHQHTASQSLPALEVDVCPNPRLGYLRLQRCSRSGF
jgi:hypothetical protein